jgi:glucan-binding YG repeat protein
MGFKDPKFDDRQRVALEAKKALLEKFKAKPGPGHPEYEAREKERLAVLAARAERQAAKEAEAQEKERLAEIERQEAKKRLQEELDRKDRERIEREEREKEEEAQKKAERDARYAARKARANKKR